MTVMYAKGTKLKYRKWKYIKFVWKTIRATLGGTVLSDEQLARGVMGSFYLMVPLDEAPEKTKDLIVAEVLKNMKSRSIKIQF